MKDYYLLLNVKRDASIQEIKESYHLLMKMLHPDKYDKFKQKEEWEKANNYVKELNEAYNVLRDPIKRKEYDKLLSGQQKDESKCYKNEKQKEENVAQPKIRPTSHLFNTTIDFKILPDEIKKRLQNVINKDNEDKITLWESDTQLQIFIFAISFITLIITFFLTNSYIWSAGKKIIILLFNFASLLGMAYAINIFYRWNKSKIRPKEILTPLYFIRCGYDKIYFRWLWDMEDFKATHNYNDQTYINTTITFIFGRDSESFTLSSKAVYDKVINKLYLWNKFIIEAKRTGDFTFLRKFDYFVNITDKYIFTRKETKPYFLFSVVLLVFGVNYLLLNGLNKYYDDIKSWKRALEINTATGYRLYLSSHVDGKFRTGAKEKIEILYNDAINKYSKTLVGDYKNEAVESIIYLLENAKLTGNFNVPVYFLGKNNIPTGIENIMKKRYGVSNVLNIGDAFSQTRMRSRESNILNEIKNAFGQIIPGDILNFTQSSDSNSLIVIKYNIYPEGLYYFTTKKNMSYKISPFYPGIIIQWDCSIKNGFDGYYKFVLKSEPAKYFRTTKETVYDDMANTAFNDFRRVFILYTGINIK